MKEKKRNKYVTFTIHIEKIKARKGDIELIEIIMLRYLLKNLLKKIGMST